MHLARCLHAGGRREPLKRVAPVRQNKKSRRRGNFFADVSVLCGVGLDEAVMPELPAHWLIRGQRSSTPIVGSYQVRSIMAAQAPVYAFNRILMRFPYWRKYSVFDSKRVRFFHEAEIGD
jgi:hypothetical protein